MKLSPQIEAKLITAGVLSAIVVFTTLGFLAPEFLYVFILGGLSIGGVRLIYEMALEYVDRRNTIKRLGEELAERDRSKVEKNNVHV